MFEKAFLSRWSLFAAIVHNSHSECAGYGRRASSSMELRRCDLTIRDRGERTPMSERIPFHQQVAPTRGDGALRRSASAV